MIIGLSGYAQSGKDTVAKVLIEEYGFTRIAFADKIREFLYDLNPQVKVGYDTMTNIKLMVDLDGWDKAKQNPTVRKLLQDIGVSARNIFGEDFWVEQALKPVASGGNYVITDVRFPNEAVAVRKFGESQVWRIKRDGVEAVNRHISEIAMDDQRVDQILTNRGTIEDLNELVRNRMEFVFSKK